MAETKKTGGAAPTDVSKASDEAAKDAGVEVKDVTQLDRDEVGSEVADNTGQISNRVEGTLQSEPKAEELPTDALVSPVAEQLMPNSKLSVGHLTKDQLPDLPGIDQEPDRNLKPDMSEVELPKGSQQGKQLERAVDGAARRAEGARETNRARPNA